MTIEFQHMDQELVYWKDLETGWGSKVCLKLFMLQAAQTQNAGIEIGNFVVHGFPKAFRKLSIFNVATREVPRAAPMLVLCVLIRSLI